MKNKISVQSLEIQIYNKIKKTKMTKNNYKQLLQNISVLTGADMKLNLISFSFIEKIVNSGYIFWLNFVKVKFRPLS